jgi:hypothetical protein
MFRIFDEIDGQPATLFHGINGSRKLPLGTWIVAKTGMVRDGIGKYYKSGFHVLPTMADIVKFAKVFKNRKNRYFVEVNVKELHSKQHSRGPVFLARKMKISKKNWENRTPI